MCLTVGLIGLNKRRTLILGSTIILSLMVLASVMPAQSIATPGAWRLISPTEYTATPDAELHGIYLTNGGTSGKGSGSGWAVGAGGFIYYWDGFSWNQASSPTNCELDAVNFGGPLNPLTSITSSSGWAVGGCGGVAKSVYFNGFGWSGYPVPSTGAGKLLSVSLVQSASSSTSNVQAFAVGADAGLAGGGFWVWNGVPGNGGFWNELPAPATATQVNGVYMTHCVGSNPCSADDGIAVGNIVAGFGAIYHWTGGNWNLLASHPSLQNLNAVSMVSQMVGWAVGDQCNIVRTLDSVNWAIFASPAGCVAANNLRSIVMLSTSEAWAVGDGDAAGAAPAILHGTTLDSVPTWTRVPINQVASSGGLDSVTFATSGGNIWAVGKSGVATFCLTNCGSVSSSIWSTTTSPNTLQLDSVFMPSDSDGWAVGTPDPVTNEPSVLRWDGGSFSWTKAPSVLPLATPTFLLGVYLSSGSNGWAVGGTPGPGPATLWYNGNSWSGEPVPACACVLRSVYMVSDSNSFAVGDNGVIMHSPTSGGAFGITLIATPDAGTSYNSVYFDPTSGGASGWVVGQDLGAPYVAHTTDHGATWPSVTIPTAAGFTTLNSVFFQDSTHGWAAGDGSTILYWNGISWTLVSVLGIINAPITITGIAVTGGPPATDGWAVGFDNSGLPVTIHYDGTSSTWTQTPLSPGVTIPAALTSVALRSSTNGLAVGTDFTGFPNSLSMILHLDPPPGGGGTVTVASPITTTTTAPATTSSTAATTSSSAAATTSTPATSATSSSSSLTPIITSTTTSVKTSIATTTAGQTVTASSSSSAITPVALPGIPGFPWESIVVGVVVGLVVLGMARRRREPRSST